MSDSRQEWEEYCKGGSIYLQTNIGALRTPEGRKVSVKGTARLGWAEKMGFGEVGECCAEQL